MSPNKVCDLSVKGQLLSAGYKNAITRGLKMLSDSYKDELVNEIAQLDPESQRRVLDFAKALTVTKNRGISGKQLLMFSGLIPHEDLVGMEHAIEEYCERVDRNEW